MPGRPIDQVPPPQATEHASGNAQLPDEQDLPLFPPEGAAGGPPQLFPALDHLPEGAQADLPPELIPEGLFDDLV